MDRINNLIESSINTRSYTEFKQIYTEVTELAYIHRNRITQEQFDEIEYIKIYNSEHLNIEKEYNSELTEFYFKLKGRFLFKDFSNDFKGGFLNLLDFLNYKFDKDLKLNDLVDYLSNTLYIYKSDKYYIFEK